MIIKRILRMASRSGNAFEQFQSIKSEKLNDKDLNDHLSNLKLEDWKYNRQDGKLTKRVCTKDMKNNSNELLQSINSVAQRLGVKPDYVTGYDYVEVSVYSPDLKGVSQKDVGLASAINRLEKRHREYCKEPKSGYRCELKEDEEREIYSAVSGRAENSNHGYGQQSGYAQKDATRGQKDGHGQKEHQPKGPSYTGSQSGQKHDDKTAADGYNFNGANKSGAQGLNREKNSNDRYVSSECSKMGSDHKHEEKCNPNYDQKQQSKNAYQSGQESNYGKGSKSDQGVRKEDRNLSGNKQGDHKQADPKQAREENQKVNARQNQDQDKTKKLNNDSNEFPHDRTGHLNNGSHAKDSQPKDNYKSPYGESSHKTRDGKEEPKGKFGADKPSKNAHEDKDKYLNEKSYK